MEYEINKDTLAIIPTGENKCNAIEKNNTYSLDVDTISVMEHSCEYFGSTLFGRQVGTKKLIGVTHKAPIIIEESGDLIFFPLSSPFRANCAWISLNNILNYMPTNNGNNSIIEFKSGDKIEVPISIGSLNNQIMRASRLQIVLTQRKNESLNIKK